MKPWIWPAWLGLAACSNELERPTPPDLSALQTRYDLITGTLDEQSAPLLLEAVQDKLGILGDYDALIDLILGVFGDVEEVDSERQAGQSGLAVARQGLTAEDIDISAGAWGIYVRTCPGWEGDSRNRRGNLRMTILFTEDGLEPVIWGALRSCRIEAGKLQLNGELAVRLLAPEDQLSQGLTGLLIRFSGDYAAEGPLQALAFDAKVVPSEALLTAVEVEGQSFLVGFTFDGAVQVIDAQGEWRCDTNRCAGPDALEVRF